MEKDAASLKVWEDLTEADFRDMIRESDSDIAAGRVYSRAEADAYMQEILQHGYL